MRAYIASPYGFSYSTRYFMETVYIPQLSLVIEPINPWDLSTKEEIDYAESAGTVYEFAMEIGKRNQIAIDSSDVIIAALDGQEVDCGTSAEIGYAFGKGKTIFGYRSDFRQAGEKGSLVNLQIEYFIRASGGEIFQDLTELVTHLQRFTSTHSRNE